MEKMPEGLVQYYKKAARAGDSMAAMMLAMADRDEGEFFESEAMKPMFPRIFKKGKKKNKK